MSDLISRSALKTAFEEDGHLSAYIEEYIDDATAVDAMPVVRCKDCKRCAGPMPQQKDKCVCVYWAHLTDPDGYCHKGVKRDATEGQ